MQQEVKQESKTEPQDDDSDCLGDFTKASVRAFRKRKATKAKVARLLKRPSASLKDESAGGKPAQAEHKTKVEVMKKDIMTSMPTATTTGAPPS